MPQFEKFPIADMPPPPRGKHSGSFAQAIRELCPTEALFVPCSEGETISVLTQRLQSNVSKLKAHMRIDRDRNGVWIYKRES